MKAKKSSKSKRLLASHLLSYGEEKAAHIVRRRGEIAERKTGIVIKNFAPVNKRGVRKFVYLNPSKEDLNSVILASGLKQTELNMIKTKLKELNGRIVIGMREQSDQINRFILVDDSKVPVIK